MKFTLRKRFGVTHIGIALFTIVFISLSSTLGYYFYSDDYSMLYHLQNNITPQWPYAFVPVIYKPIYKLFGLMPEAYALMGVLTYFSLTLLVYLLNNIILKNKLISFFSSAIFATGYIGIDQFTQLAVAPVNNLSNIFICIAIIIYLRFLQTKKKTYYFFCLLLFILTMVVFPFRVFPLLLFMPTIHALLTLNLKLNKSLFKQLFFIIFLQIPFLIIAYFSGVFSYGSDPEVETVIPNLTLWRYIFVIITPELLSEIPRIIGRFILPEAFASSAFKIAITQGQYFLIGLIFVVLTTLLGFYFYFHQICQRYARGMLFFLIMSIGGFIGNLILLPSFDADGPVNRYLSLSFIGYSAVFSVLSYFIITNLFKKFSKNSIYVYALFMVLTVLIFLDQTRAYEKKILDERSIPSENFYKELLKYVPEISTRTIFFFDYADYHPTYSRFGNLMVGAYLPREAALAVHYKRKLDLIKIPNSFEEFITEIQKSPDQKFYTFYYDQKGLRNTTKKLSDLLSKGGEKSILNNEKVNTDSFNPTISVLAEDVLSLSPYKLIFSLRAASLDYSIFSFPYTNLNSEDKIIEDYKSGKVNKSKIFEYLDSRRNYYDKVSAKVSSSHIYGMHPAELLIDKKEETYWLENQSSYAFDVKPWIEIDLGEERKLSKILWVNESEPRFPKDFIIEVSKDKKVWEKVKVGKRERLKGDSLIETVSFSPVNARFVKLHILSTQAYEPGFSEIEIIDKRVANVNLVDARRIKENPFEFIHDAYDLAKTYEFLENNSTLTIQTLTNRENQISNIYDLKLPVYIDGLFHEYSINIPPRGVNLQEIIFKLPFPAQVSVSEISVEYQKIKN